MQPKAVSMNPQQFNPKFAIFDFSIICDPKYYVIIKHIPMSKKLLTLDYSL